MVFENNFRGKRRETLPDFGSQVHRFRPCNPGRSREIRPRWTHKPGTQPVDPCYDGTQCPIAFDSGTDVSNQFPWYDSWWLKRYVLAKKYIAQRYPSQLDAFTEALSPLRTRADFQVQRHERFFNEDQIRTIQDALADLKPDLLETHELSQHGRFVIHDHPILVDLHAAIAPTVSELVGEKVEPIYTFIALSDRIGRCPVHLDAPASNWTLDFCIAQSEPWPISFSEVVPWPEDFEGDHNGWAERIRYASGHNFTSVSMEPGQAVDRKSVV